MKRDTYLKLLDRRLCWRCGRSERREILADYAEAFRAGLAEGNCEEALCRSFGTPDEAAAVLLRERRTHVWEAPITRFICFVAALLLFLLHFWLLSESMRSSLGYLVISVTPVLLFFAVGGPEIMSGVLPQRRLRHGKTLAALLALAAMCCLAAGLVELWYQKTLTEMFPHALKLVRDGARWRDLVEGFACVVLGLGAVLAAGAWLSCFLSRPGAKGLFPAAFLVAACAGNAWQVRCDRWLDKRPVEQVFNCLGVLLFSLGVALVFAFLLRRIPWCVPEREGPARVRRVAALQQDAARENYLELLARMLRFGFSQAERREILRDYSECFEEGVAEGRGAQDLCAAFGKPQAVAKVLKRERLLREIPQVRLAALGLAAAGAWRLITLHRMRAEWRHYVYAVSEPAFLFVLLAAAMVVPVLLLFMHPPRPAVRGMARTVYPLLAGAALSVAVSCGALLLVLFVPGFEWFGHPEMIGPSVAAILSFGAVLLLAEAVLEMCVFSGGTPLLFVNAGLWAAIGGQLVWLSAMDTPDGALRRMLLTLVPAVVGLLLALVFAAVRRYRRPGGGAGASAAANRATSRTCEERDERIRRVSLRAAALR